MSSLDEAINLAAGLCREFEGFYPKPYLCPANVATIGIGTTRYENGTPVTLADPAIDAQRAEELLSFELKHVCVPGVFRMCPNLVAEEPGRIAALIDWTYNLGVGRLQTSTLRRVVSKGDWLEAKTQIKRWVYGGGRVLPGLVKRRQAEILLIG